MSKQNVNLTWQTTRRPERIALCRTTPLNLGSLDAKWSVGPLPTDCPYKIKSSWLTPYSVSRHSYTASMSAYVFSSLGWIPVIKSHNLIHLGHELSEILMMTRNTRNNALTSKHV